MNSIFYFNYFWSTFSLLNNKNVHSVSNFKLRLLEEYNLLENMWVVG